MDEEKTTDLDLTYLDEFKEHVEKTRGHLRGFGADEPPLAPSYIGQSFWTPEQKGFFFAALNRHGRFFVDAIAAEVPEKSVVEVQNYLTALKYGARRNPSVFTRDSFEAAAESSERLINFEDENAYIISNMEPKWAEAIAEQEIRSRIKFLRYEMRKEYGEASDRRDGLEDKERSQFLFKLETELLANARANSLKGSLSSKELRICDDIIRQSHDSKNELRRNEKPKFYDLKTKLKSIGLNASTLKADGLDFFHLKNLGKLMQSNSMTSLKSGHNSTPVGSRISEKTIQLLQAETACFISEVLKFAIGLHETQNALVDDNYEENDTKPYRSIIKGLLIERALDLMGLERKKVQRLKMTTRRLATYRVTGAEEVDDDLTKWAASYGVEVPEPLVPFTQQMNEHYLVHNLLDSSDFFPYLARNLVSPNANEADEPLLLSVQEDIDEYDAEIKDEELVDEQDIAYAKDTEDIFWELVESRREGKATNDGPRRTTKRKREGSGPKTGSKSKLSRTNSSELSTRVSNDLYIEDSDQ